MKLNIFKRGAVLGKLKSIATSRKEGKDIKPILLTEALVRSPAKSGNS